MSEYWMIVIPRDPWVVPPQDRREAALAVLRQLRPDANECKVTVTDAPEFVYALGAGPEAIFCPFCESDVTDYFHDHVGGYYDQGKKSLDITAPCCGRATTLDDLDHLGTQGFACVQLGFTNAGPDLEPFELAEVEEALGVPARIVWRKI